MDESTLTSQLNSLIEEIKSDLNEVEKCVLNRNDAVEISYLFTRLQRFRNYLRKQIQGKRSYSGRYNRF